MWDWKVYNVNIILYKYIYIKIYIASDGFVVLNSYPEPRYYFGYNTMMINDQIKLGLILFFYFF